MANGKRPETLRDFTEWLDKTHGVRVDERAHNHYEVATRALRRQFEESLFWQRFVREWGDMDSRYHRRHGLFLFMKADPPEVVTKPFDSMLDKAFRIDVVNNAGWPSEPLLGWVLPANWLASVNDVVRTSVPVKYLDGVTFLVEQIQSLASSIGVGVTVDYEAREEGYYAAHVYAQLVAEVPGVWWDTERTAFTPEIQITTQLQEAIRVLTHPFYLERRSRSPGGAARKWQWEYDTDEFRANYLAHTLHHIEGMIMDLRARTRR